MAKKCKRCFGVHILTSKIRWTDLPALLLLLRPVRCYYCRRRQYTSLLPVVGSIYRTTVALTAIAAAAMLFYTHILERPLPPLESLKIDVSKVWIPGDSSK